MAHDSEIKRLDFIQNIINQLGMRFPVAEISEKTGFNRGYISSILQGKKPISDKFFDSFVKHFVNKNDTSNHTSMSVPVEFEKLIEVVRSAEQRVLEKEEARRQDAEARLKQADAINDRLMGLLETNLGKVSATIEKVMKLQTAHDEVMMKSLDRLEKRPEGTLSGEADNLEMEIDQRLQNLSDTDKKVVSNK
jgi:hypothetical protein